MNINGIVFEPELSFKASRSGGAGGQHVNKVSSKVELEFDVLSSGLLTDEQKAVVMDKLANRITKEGVLKMVVQEDRSQLANKEAVVKKFYALMHSCFVVRKKRKATKPSRSSKEKRLTSKKRDAEIKKLRKKDW